jgi:hypothetical protein
MQKVLRRLQELEQRHFSAAPAVSQHMDFLAAEMAQLRAENEALRAQQQPPRK